MYQDAPVSMIEPSHGSPLASSELYGKKRRNLLPFVVIGVCVGLLVVLAAVLLTLVKNSNDAASYRYLPDYKKTYKCATDEYNYHDGVFEIQLGLKEDGTYKFAFSDNLYDLGTFTETNQTYAKSEDGANEINYYLSLKKEKTILENKDITEEAGSETKIILNINENSDVIVLTDEDDNASFYCNVKE